MLLPLDCLTEDSQVHSKHMAGHISCFDGTIHLQQLAERTVKIKEKKYCSNTLKLTDTLKKNPEDVFNFKHQELVQS